MAMLRGLSTAVLGIPADPSVEGVDVVAVAQPGGAGTTSTTGSRLPIATLHVAIFSSVSGTS